MIQDFDAALGRVNAQVGAQKRARDHTMAAGGSRSSASPDPLHEAGSLPRSPRRRRRRNERPGPVVKPAASPPQER
jgi:hypothetical protein